MRNSVDKLSKQKKSGLVFENHLPECTPLYDVPIKNGSKVALKTGKINDIYTILSVSEGKAGDSRGPYPMKILCYRDTCNERMLCRKKT